MEQAFWEINGNKWSKDKFSEEEAKALSNTLCDCIDCVDCVECKRCEDCKDCISYENFENLKEVGDE
ncbi:hypothetical protein [Helicobacter sp. MIT 05-5294]|uniref:hypothetical protein n=1 Tax=Helicobacter sp. MIT 05-5294 TaxID=1548150 RepID=UPI0010FF5998|nr:hypothetical protein [Helicobacter sp. MIT 05-5294]TLD85825.1 hypothetical protein LS69_007980 [Helicobacter sp. MIT 05-5294]